MREAKYIIFENDYLGQEPLVIKDMGPWNNHLTITNDAEGVVQRLVQQGHLSEGRRLFYYDSEGEFSEILVRDGFFAGFAPCQKEKTSLYPEGWPKCPSCGEPALDGHITCGKAECGEGRCRDEKASPAATSEAMKD